MASMAMPTTDPAELEKRITDLKTVEQWLDFNLTLLRTTIQGLEIQRGTLLALKAWQSQGSESEATDTASEAPGADANLWWTAMQDQFQQLMQAAQNLQTEAASATGFHAASSADDRQAPAKRAPRKKASAPRLRPPKPLPQRLLSAPRRVSAWRRRVSRSSGSKRCQFFTIIEVLGFFFRSSSCRPIKLQKNCVTGHACSPSLWLGL